MLKKRTLKKESGERFILQPQYKEIIINVAVIFVAGCVAVFYFTPLYTPIWILACFAIVYYNFSKKKIIVLKDDGFIITNNFKKVYDEQILPYSSMKEIYYHSSSAIAGDILKVIFKNKHKEYKIRYEIVGKQPFEIFDFLISKDVLLFIDDTKIAEYVFKMKEKDMYKEGTGLNIYATGQTHLIKKTYT